ncbi:delta-endotoxin CytB [Marasmius fiardii PR-910]|nr:delta-endotoxin CytB [Marasmius fiardii PR-910]
MTDDKLYFDRFSKRLGDLDPTFLQVAKFASHSVDLNEPKAFNWPKFQRSVSQYQGDDLLLEKFNNLDLSPQEQTVEDLITKIVDFLLSAFGVLLMPVEIDALTQTIETTFTNLKDAKKNNWADFKQTGSNSSWEYRIHFAFPNPNLPDYFYTLVTTIKLGADVTDEDWWFKLTTETKGNFSVDSDAMRLIVKKGFKDPQN